MVVTPAASEDCLVPLARTRLCLVLCAASCASVAVVLICLWPFCGHHFVLTLFFLQPALCVASAFSVAITLCYLRPLCSHHCALFVCLLPLAQTPHHFLLPPLYTCTHNSACMAGMGGMQSDKNSICVLLLHYSVNLSSVEKQKKQGSSFGQPTRLITCTNHGNNVIYSLKSIVCATLT